MNYKISTKTQSTSVIPDIVQLADFWSENADVSRT